MDIDRFHVPPLHSGFSVAQGFEPMTLVPRVCDPDHYTTTAGRVLELRKILQVQIPQVGLSGSWKSVEVTSSSLRSSFKMTTFVAFVSRLHIL
ncbi:hypothetical protein TNCV_770531 [Trichonephila clavipes]|nr:hypothetical protein TNCV_770531 [Trichonephila clavipes]